MEEVPGSSKFFPTQLVLLALGFLGPENAVIKALGVKQDGRSNIQTPLKVSFINSGAVGRNHSLELTLSPLRNIRRTSRVSLLLVTAGGVRV